MVPITYEKTTLSNGLDVILHEDHSLPLVAVNIWYHVGSKDEEPGRTGFAHLFEHVMFEGSKHHNRNFFEPLQEVGAAINGSTSADRTNYWVNLPPNYLELALWLESDRMGFLLDALDQKRFDVQREVVKNERRQSYENRPYGMASLLLQPAVFPPPHPYHWTTIGSPEDLDAAKLDDIKGFFRRYYAPSNASLAIVGDFAPDAAMALVERYFGDLPPGPPINRVGRMDSGLKGHVSLTMGDRVQLDRLYLVWPTGPMFDADEAPLDMLSAILADGKSSRLYRSLVYEKQIARDVGVFAAPQEIAGEFHLQVTANAGHSLEEIESEVMAEIERIRREPPAEKEVARAKNRIQSHHVIQLEHFGGFGGRADQLNHYNTMAGDPGLINSDLDRYLTVTAGEIQRVASAELGKSFVRLSVTPERPLSPSARGIDRTVKPQPSPAPTFSPPLPRRARLSNGVGVVMMGKPGPATVALGLLIRAGAVTDAPTKSGLASMTATLLPEGTTTRTSMQIADEMEFLGASLNSGASREYVLLSIETLTSHWIEALEILADVATNPTFPSEEVERVRREKLTDLGRIADNPGAIAGRASRALLYGPDTRFGHPASGVEDSVRAISRDDLQGQYSSFYRPENATLLVVGDVSDDEVVSQVERHFGRWAVDGSAPSAPVAPSADAGPRPATPTTIYLADKPGAAQSVIRAGHLTIPRHHRDYYTMNLLNYVFGGQYSARLNMNLRQDKGYSYGYMSSIDWSTGPSAIMAGGGVQTDVTKEAVIETLKEFEQIRDARPVTEQEFVAARDGLLRGLPSQFETRSRTLQQLTRLVVFGLPDDYFETLTGRIEAISLEDIHRASRERLDSAHLMVLVVGDASVVETGLRELDTPVALVDYEGRPLPQG